MNNEIQNSQWFFGAGKSIFAIFLGSFLLVLIFSSTHTYAAEKKDKATRRLQQMMQQIQQEKTELQTQLDAAKQANTELETKLKQSDEELAVLNKKLIVSNNINKSLTADLKIVRAEKDTLEIKQQKLESDLAHMQQMLADLTTQYQAAQEDIKVGENQRKNQLVSIQEKSKSLDICEQKNQKLYDFGLDLIKTFEKPSEYEMALRTEKFTQLKRVQLENVIQEYRDKLDEAKLISTNR